MPINKEYVPIDNQPTIKPRTVTGIFTRYIAKTLPLAFDESMSYYECLCALLEYLNDTIVPDINNTNDGLGELQGFYEDLQNYVNNYFDNLDVQEEINNKLDEMTQDGTLYNIIRTYTDPIINQQNQRITNVENELQSVASGSPLVASSTSGMTDTTRVYVNTSDGNWYYYDGSSWQIGGVYQSTGISENSINYKMLDVGLKSLANITKPTITLNDGYIDGYGHVQEVNNYSYSSPIHLLENQTIMFYGQGYNTNVGMISLCDSTGNNVVNLMRSTDSNVNLYQYTTDSECYVIISGRTQYFDNYFVGNKIPNLNSDDLNELTNFQYLINNIETLPTETGYIQYDNGNVVSSSTLEHTDFIELSINNINATLSNIKNVFHSSPDLRGLAFYDSKHKYISGAQYPNSLTLNLTIPLNAKYVRFTIRPDYYVKMRLKVKLTDYLTKLNSDNDDLSNPLATLIDGNSYVNIFNKISCIGDSLTKGTFESNNTGTTVYNIFEDYSYPKQLERMLNTNVYNLGRGGATTKSWYNNSFSEITEDNLSECYIIALGTNDIGYNGSFNGDVSTDIDLDNYNNNADTSVGWYARIIQHLKELQPKVKIFCVGIPNTRNSLATRTQANNLIRSIVELFDNTYFLDLQTYGVSVTNVKNYKDIYYMGGHLNSLGYVRFAMTINTYIDYIIRNNYNDFDQIPFIGTDLSYN